MEADQKARINEIIEEIYKLLDTQDQLVKLEALTLLVRVEELITSSEYQAVLRHKKPKAY